MSGPLLFIKEITDQVIRRNFENLVKYFRTNGQLDGFRFIEFSTENAQENMKVAHALGFKPRDIIRTKVVGPGKVTFNHSLFDDQFMDVTTTGTVRVRCFVGTYEKDISQTEESDSEVEEMSGQEEDASTNTPTTVTNVTNNYVTNPTTTVTTGAPIGAMLAWPLAVDPGGDWMLITSGVYSRTTYAALFAVYGTTFNTGGEGANEFRLPATWGRALIGAGTYTDTVLGATTRTLGTKLGAASHIITANEMPAHSHDAVHLRGFGAYAAGVNYFTEAGTNTGRTTTVTTDTKGGSTAHNNMQPSLVVNVIVKYR